MSGSVTSLKPALSTIARLGVIPVVEIDDIDRVEGLGTALSRARLPLVELTLRTPRALDALTAMRERFSDLLLGAGTVRTVSDARCALTAGADFLVSPCLDLGILEVARDAGRLAVPGIATPTELQTAIAHGAAVVKFFPAEALGGVTLLKTLAAPFPDARFIPTGGVGADNLASYLALPQVAAVGGSWVAPAALLREGAFDEVQRRAADAVRRARAARP